MPPSVSLREVRDSDLPIFFEHQRDADANAMAAFPARDADSFAAHWAKIRANPKAVLRTILAGETVAGNMASWQQEAKRLVAYWLGREYWGKGVATQALAQFVEALPTRPLYAFVATTNRGSIRVLEKNGFRAIGLEEGVSLLGGPPADEYTMMLGTPAPRPAHPPIRLEPWTSKDMWLMRRINEPDMTEFTGGQESEEKITRRFERYVNATTPKERVFKIVTVEDGRAVGSIGYWEIEWQGTPMYEAGWAVLPEHKGRGVASDAVGALVEKARAERTRRVLVAFPKTRHLASNAVCRKAGLTFAGACDFEYPVGNKIRCNDWRLELWPAP